MKPKTSKYLVISLCLIVAFLLTSCVITPKEDIKVYLVDAEKKAKEMQYLIKCEGQDIMLAPVTIGEIKETATLEEKIRITLNELFENHLISDNNLKIKEIIAPQKEGNIIIDLSGDFTVKNSCDKEKVRVQIIESIRLLTKNRSFIMKLDSDARNFEKLSQ